MPKKILVAEAMPSSVQERLVIWGRCIRTQRKMQRITGASLCKRMGISMSTLQRLEAGDPGAGAGTYLNAMMILGMMDLIAPVPAAHLWSINANSRVRLSLAELDDDTF